MERGDREGKKMSTYSSGSVRDWRRSQNSQLPEGRRPSVNGDPAIVNPFILELYNAGGVKRYRVDELPEGFNLANGSLVQVDDKSSGGDYVEVNLTRWGLDLAKRVDERK